MRIPQITIVLVLLATGACAGTADERLLAEVSSLRLAGELAEARAMAEQALEKSDASADAILMHLELARIHDRYGLHNNTRPVAEALRHVQLAESLVEPGEEPSRARVDLAYADYYYRAEMPDREFTTATQHAERAIDLFTALDDWQGGAEAVHRLGLIRMQQGRYEEARDLFDESLALDIRGGERVFFRGEYERHVGFVDYLTGDREAAIPHFERSLQARQEAGAIDASLHAAVSLASTLVESGRAAEAGEHLKYALEIARRIGSRYGEAIALLALGRYHRELGNEDQARAALERAAEVARSIGSASIESRANEALATL
jgi:tetratricopeptide (TPR) repeat protein